MANNIDCSELSQILSFILYLLLTHCDNYNILKYSFIYTILHTNMFAIEQLSYRLFDFSQMFQFHTSFNRNPACDLYVTMFDLPLARKCLNECVYT